jgi:hypothetical protein
MLDKEIKINASCRLVCKELILTALLVRSISKDWEVLLLQEIQYYRTITGFSTIQTWLCCNLPPTCHSSLPAPGTQT